MKKIINLDKASLRAIMYSGIAMIAILSVVTLGVPTANAAITNTLDFGDTGSQVSELQTYLSTDVSLYPSRLVTGYYGSLTVAGVQRFQAQQGIVSSGSPATTGYGRVGPRTVTAINAHFARGDENAPIITSVSTSVANSSAVVSWTSSEFSKGKVYYSTSPIRMSNLFDVTGVFSGEPIVSGTLAYYDGVARASQSVSISNLMPNTDYYYQVVALDASNNISLTTPAMFRTN